LLLRFKTSDDPTMSDHRIMIGRSLCRNFAHHWCLTSKTGKERMISALLFSYFICDVTKDVLLRKKSKFPPLAILELFLNEKKL
jgi:hypothetical protein